MIGALFLAGCGAPATPTPAATLANGGPAEWAGNEYGGTLVPVQNDAIAVVSEQLTIDFSATSDNQQKWLVPIKATYVEPLLTIVAKHREQPCDAGPPSYARMSVVARNPHIARWMASPDAREGDNAGSESRMAAVSSSH